MEGCRETQISSRENNFSNQCAISNSRRVHYLLNNGLKLSKKCGNYGFTGIDLTIYIESDKKRTCDVRGRANAENRTK